MVKLVVLGEEEIKLFRVFSRIIDIETYPFFNNVFGRLFFGLIILIFVGLKEDEEIIKVEKLRENIKINNNKLIFAMIFFFFEKLCEL